MIEKLLVKASSNPPLMFLIDGLGAILSAILLGIVLPNVNDLIGMPMNALYFLASFPILFAIYDGWVYFNSYKNYASLLRIIAIANVAYCLISLGAVSFHFQVLTSLGLAYFMLELVIVALLGFFELSLAKHLAE